MVSRKAQRRLILKDCSDTASLYLELLVCPHHADQRYDQIEGISIDAVQRIGTLIDKCDNGDARLDDLHE